MLFFPRSTRHPERNTAIEEISDRARKSGPHSRDDQSPSYSPRVQAVAVALVAVAPLDSTASASTVVGAGTITAVASPGIALHVPADGRLDGSGFAVDVSGYRFAYGIGYGPNAEEASAGQVLLVFALSGSGADIQAQLLVDGFGTVLPHATTPNASTPAYFLASVPVTARPTSPLRPRLTASRKPSASPRANVAGRSNPSSFTGVEGPVASRGYHHPGHHKRPHTGQQPCRRRPRLGRELRHHGSDAHLFPPGHRSHPGNPTKAWLVVLGLGATGRRC